mgnify:CR=1 FL=1|jgi:hypothetical protein
MTGYIEGSEPSRFPFGKLPKFSNDDRVRYESQGNLSVQTIVLLTQLETLMERTNELLEKLNDTMEHLVEATRDASPSVNYSSPFGGSKRGGGKADFVVDGDGEATKS